MHMRGPRETVLPHGGRQLSDMSTLELIDVSLEDDSLLPPTISPPLDKPLDCVLRLSPSVKSAKKTPGPFSASCEEEDNTVAFSTPRAHSEGDASPADSALCFPDANIKGGHRLTKSEARTKTFKFFQHLKGNMAKSEEKLPTRAVLTPTRTRAVSWNDARPRDGQQATEPGQLMDKQFDCQDSKSNQDQQYAEPQSSVDKPARRTRSARAIHSLRKSLAWDKAFSTEEGILDGDELPLVTKTPKKLPDLPPLDLPDILALVSPAVRPAPTTSADAAKSVPDSELPTAVKPISDSLEHRPNTPNLQGSINAAEPIVDLGRTDLSTSREANSPIAYGTRHSTSQSTTSAVMSPTNVKSLSAIPRPVPVTQVIEDAVEKGTKLRLPSSLVHFHHRLDKGAEEHAKHELNAKSQKELENLAKHRQDTQQTMKPVKDMHTLTRCRSTSSLIKPPSTSTSISKRVSSVSKKVKDTLGRVLPGMGGRLSASRKAIAETAHMDRLRPSVPQTSSTGLKVPGSPGPSNLTRSKSARAAVNGITAETNIHKTGVLAELSNKGSSSNASVKVPPGQKKSKGESIWGSIRGRSGSSSSKGSDNVPLNKSIPSPPAVKKTDGTAYEVENSHLHDLEVSPSGSVLDPSSQISKPSGLRLPSPKIGFFDSGRPAGAHDKPTVAVTDVVSKHGLPPRPPSQHVPTSTRSANVSTVDPLVAAVRGYLSSGIPVAPHVTRASGKSGRRGLVPSASAPASPRKNSEMLSPGTHQAVTGRYLTSRSNSTRVHIEASPERRKEASGAARKLTLEHNDGKVQKVAGGADDAAVKESSPVTTACGDEVQNTGDTCPVACSSQPAKTLENSAVADTVIDQPADETLEDSATADTVIDQLADETLEDSATADTVIDLSDVIPAKEPVEGSGIESNQEVSPGSVSRAEETPTCDLGVTSAFSGDLADRILVDECVIGAKNECIDHLVESLHNSPSIQSTFWDLQATNTVPSGNLGRSDTPTSTTENGPSSDEKNALRSEDVGTGGGDKGGPEILSEACSLDTPDKQEIISSEHASSSLRRYHGRRKSIFGWQDMHASLSSPVLNAASTDDPATRSQELESSISPSGSEGKAKSGRSLDLSKTINTPLGEKPWDDDIRAERADKFRCQEAGQIMNGATIGDLRAEPFKQENISSSKTQSVSSTEKEETSKPHFTKDPEKEILQSKLENLFESHWSGWPVLEAAAPAPASWPTSAVREASGVAGTADSRPGSNGDSRESSRDENSDSFRCTVSPFSEADASNDGRTPLGENRALLTTATDGSRLSVTPPLKRERGLLAFARSAVSRLTSAASGGLSPRDENGRAIDREGPGSGSFRKSRRQKLNPASKPVESLEENENSESVSPFSEERVRALEAAVQEAILMKRGGAVQHSPPNKTQPPPNPWSPVKKGQHPGPFDCTKKTAVNTTVM